MPFTVAVESGVASIMTAHVAYPALDPSGLPATLSRPIMAELRERLGFDGLVVTDALIMDGALVGRRESDAAVEAIQAGVDLLLYPNDARRVRDALEQALASGALAPDRLEESLAPLRPRPRAGHRADAAGHPRARSSPPTRWPTRCWRRACCAARAPTLRGPLDLVVVDDDLGGPYPPGPSDWVHQALGAEPDRALRRRVAGGAGVRRAAGVEGPVRLRRQPRATRWRTRRPAPT